MPLTPRITKADNSIVKQMYKETWKEIEGFNSRYYISNLGYIKSTLSGNDKILAGGIDRDGYYLVNLAKEGKTKMVKVHRIIAQTFIPNPENKPQVNHINGIRNDNRIQNLEWCTCKENNRHAYFILKKQSKLFFENNPNKKGAMNKRSKKVNQYSLEGKFIKTWDSIGEATRGTGILQPHICQCCKGNLKYTGGFKWYYA